MTGAAQASQNFIMIVGNVCRSPAVTIGEDADLVEAARRMRERHVGLLVVARPRQDIGDEPIGVLTDRDLVVAVVAGEADARVLRVADVMTANPAVVGDWASVEDTLRRMRELGLRRMPVVEASGRLVGLVSIDDILDRVAGTLLDVAGAIRNEQRIERQARS
jgi:CBS domain-containing protein